jgi:hypothetical protein
MAQVFRSGAFLQQCWSVHPLCVAVKRMTDDRTLILSCSYCRSVHYLALSSVEIRIPAAPQDSEHSSSDRPVPEEGPSKLAGCVGAHAEALSLREMDVFEDLALVRCAECRRHYALTVSSFETHHR